MNTTDFLLSRLKSFSHASKGLLVLIKIETNFQIHATAAVLITILGLFCNLSTIEWSIQCLIIALVLSLEAINTAIEKSLDALHPEQHSKIGLAKDIAAGAVFISVISALIIGALIYFPKLLM